MKSNLYIPKTITVGFRERSDTFTGKLGYVIYTDHKGVLRKQASWNSWRDLKIATIQLDNTPQPGFCLNKGVQRDGYWGNGRSVIRVWDPRDFEFEISVDNLIGILMHADVSKRDITEPCVFAWNGTELILLPTNSVEYQQSVEHTAKQCVTFSSRSLVAGYTYSVRADNLSVVYLGYLQRWEAVNHTYSYRRDTDVPPSLKQLKKRKGHVFIDPSTKRIYVKDPSAFISGVEVEECHNKFADLLQAYYGDINSQPWIGCSILPATEGYRTRLWGRINNTDFVEFAFTDDFIGYDNNRRPPKVEVTRFGRYDPSVPGFTFSSTDQQPNYWTARGKTVPRLAGLAIDQPEVIALGGLILSHLVANPSDKTSFTWQQKKIHMKKIFAEMYTNSNIGELSVVLSDGKIAKTEI